MKYAVLALFIVAVAMIVLWMGSREEKGRSDAAFATKDTAIRDILSLDADMANVLAKHGLHCAGCPSAVSETLEQACIVHNADIDVVLSAINSRMAEKEHSDGNKNV